MFNIFDNLLESPQIQEALTGIKKFVQLANEMNISISYQRSLLETIHDQNLTILSKIRTEESPHE